jgi:hypothetical protein
MATKKSAKRSVTKPAKKTAGKPRVKNEREIDLTAKPGEFFLVGNNDDCFHDFRGNDIDLIETTAGDATKELKKFIEDKLQDYVELDSDYLVYRVTPVGRIVNKTVLSPLEEDTPEE